MMTSLELGQRVRDILHDIHPASGLEQRSLTEYRYRLVPACAEQGAREGQL